MEHFLHHQAEIEEKLQVKFRRPELLRLSFIHRSFWNEHQDQVNDHNERLEFLGDSILGLIIAEYLYLHLPAISEGTLSDFRSRLVEAVSCVSYIQKLDISHHLLLGKGEKMNIGKGRDTILADLFEAIIGAIYLDQGYEGAKDFFLRHFEEDIERILADPAKNWKAELQDFAQKKYQQTPIYEVIEESGPAHRKIFRVAVFIKNEKIGEGEGSSKKIAQQQAAAAALALLIQDHG